MTNLHRVIEQVLGLSPEFLAFFHPKLFATSAAGITLLLCGLHLANPGGLRALWRGMGLAVAAAAVLIALPLGPRLAAERHLIEAETAHRRGDYAAAVEHLLAARSGKRALRHNWAHTHRLGQLAGIEDRPTSLESLLAQAYDALTQGRAHTAVDLLHQAHTLHPQATQVDRYLALALSDAAIDAFDMGQASVAQDYWRESLRYLAVNPMAWYGLSMVHVKQRRYAEAAQAMEHVARLQSQLGYKRLAIRAQAAVMASWAAFQRGDLAQAHELHARSLRPETW